MIKIEYGNCLDIAEGIIVHGCNCQGLMGAGFAAAVRKKWPSVYEAYAGTHKAKGLRLGETLSVASRADVAQDSRFPTLGQYVDAASQEISSGIIVVNAMTQYDCQHIPGFPDINYDALEAAFGQVNLLARATGLPVHFPLIGCGLAGGVWELVEGCIERALDDKVTKTLWKLPGA